MALEEFERDPQEERHRGYIRMRSVMDFGMGALWLAMGIFIIFIKQFHTGIEARFDDVTMRIFGSICTVYGAFRIYRGYKKNYLKER